MRKRKKRKRKRGIFSHYLPSKDHNSFNQGKETPASLCIERGKEEEGEEKGNEEEERGKTGKGKRRGEGGGGTEERTEIKGSEKE